MADNKTDFEKAQNGQELFGTPLKKWSKSRKNAADSMGLQWPNIGTSAWRKFDTTGRYPGQRRDVAITLWLLHTPDASEMTLEQIKAKDWSVNKAFNDPEEAIERAMSWLDEQEWSDTNDLRFYEAAGLALSMVLGAESSAFRVEVAGEKKTKPKKENTKPAIGLV